MTTHTTTIHLRTLAVLVIACLTMAACETPLDFDMDQTSPFTVVYAMPKADTTLSVRLSKSRFFLSQGGIEPITDAQVSLSLNGTPCTPTVDTAGYYHFSDAPHGGDTIALRISATGVEPIQASTCIPTPPDVQLTSIMSDYDPNATTDGMPSAVIRFRINDPKEENYYKVTVGYVTCFKSTYPRDTIRCHTRDIAFFSCSDPAVRTMPTIIDMLDEDDGSFYGQTM